MDITKWVLYLERQFLGLTLSQYLSIFGVCIGFVLIQWLLRTQIDQRLRAWAEKTSTQVDDILIDATQIPLRIILFSLALGIITQIWEPSAPLMGWLEKISELGLLLAGFWFLFNAVEIVPIYLHKFTEQTQSTLDDQLVPLTTKVLRVFIWVVGLIMVVQNMGYSVSGIVASLGIGGAAIAFASQDTIANVFGSLKVLLDRPFVIGDWVRSTGGDIEGVVEDIGFLSTRIRTFAKSQITVPNNKIANMAIENFSRMDRRRISMNLGVSYSTTTEQMKSLCQKIETLLRNDERLDQETIFVNFVQFNDSSLDIMLYFFTLTTEWGAWLEIKQDIYLKIMGIVDEVGTSVAFPSRSVYVESAPEGLIESLT